MRHSFRMLALAVALVAALAPAAGAGGMSARLQGPAKDGSYNLTTYSCQGIESMRPSGWAEGVVNGKRQTLPLTFQPAATAGTYTFQRTWPAGGRWLVRLTFASPSAPALVAQLGHEGRVVKSQYVWDADGKHECDTQLAAAVK